MARKLQVLLVDDLDGTDLGENGETVTFGVAGERYEIDLSHENAEKFRTQMGQYVQAARNVTRTGNRGSAHGARRTAAGSSRSSDETKAARLWLIQQGILSDQSRGRISTDNWERYHARNQQSIPATTTAKAATTEKPAAGGTAETAQKADKAPRGNSTTPAKAAADTSGTPAESKTKTGGLAKLLP